MKKITLILIAIALLSCQKEDDSIETSAKCDEYTFNLNDGDLFRLYKQRNGNPNFVNDSIRLSGCINNGASFQTNFSNLPAKIHRIGLETLVIDSEELATIIFEKVDTLKFTDITTDTSVIVRIY